ncbi:MAG: DUF262 domain-containing protein [Oscillospiraceae bacterium]|nr:DUF262 domain-containing protein [Oscillospiraceae bacterium]
MKATETTILNFVGGLDKVFIIPPFQRNYEWNFEQCDELFEDIIKSYQNKKAHYLGNIVYYVGKNNGAAYNEYILVDGQQRVTTILILLCALRDLAEEKSTADSINRRYLMNDTGDNRFRVRLKQTSYDARSFLSIVDGMPSESENNISKNYYHFIDLVKKSNISPKELYETIPSLEIVDVNLQIHDDLSLVQTVFEKINSTGKSLSPADLIRNYLLLAKSSDEQEQLYRDYWVKIEQMIKNENISRFARDYLIMNIFDDVPKMKIYKMFKEHFEATKAHHIDILKDMYKYALYFAWIKYESCPDEKINEEIKRLNFLKSDDLYPLYLYLFNELYASDTEELLRILGLLCDFIIRYRIVSPAGGGGDLRTVIQQLLENLSSGTIELNYDSVHFELSNSASPSGRYPNDEEFMRVLTDAVNTSYAKILLVKIEEYEKGSVSMPLDKIAIEHIMPQTLSDWWVENFGGREEADRIYETYINCIGNLVPVSRDYNSQNSNKPWKYKSGKLKKVQFAITSEVTDNSEWKEENIKKRNIDIAERACRATVSPLQRTRKYQTKSASSEFVSGLYSVSDITTPMNGAALESVIYDNEIIEVTAWREFFAVICEKAYSVNSKLFDEIVEENKIHKATMVRNYPHKDPVISKDPSHFLTPVAVGDTGYYSEGALSSNRSRMYAKQLLDLYGMTERFQISVS